MGEIKLQATPPQRALLARLLREAEYDPRTVTLMHRNLGVGDMWVGKPVDEWLATLSTARAHELIDKLQEQARDR